MCIMIILHTRCDRHTLSSVLSLSKHSLGSHEYVQSCRKWENEITLQLLSHSTMRRDLARSVSLPLD